MVADDVSFTVTPFTVFCAFSWLTLWHLWQGSNKSPLVSLIAGGAAGGVEATITYR